MPRTIQDALRHAESQAQYAQSDSPYLVQDLIALANELSRMRAANIDGPRGYLRSLSKPAHFNRQTVDRIMRLLHGVLPGSNRETARNILLGETIDAKDTEGS